MGNPTYGETIYVDDCLNDPSNCPTAEEKVAEEENHEPISVQDNPSIVMSFIKMVFVLVLILGLIYGLLKFIKRHQQTLSQTKVLENLGGITVGQQKSIQLIRVGKKVYLLGVGDNVELLKEITDEETMNEIFLQTEETMFQHQSFFLKPIIDKLFRKSEKGSTKEKHFVELFSKELEKFTKIRRELKEDYLRRD